MKHTILTAASILLLLPTGSQATTYVFSIIDHPEAVSAQKFTAINDSGLIGGYYYHVYGHSFLFDGREFTPFDYATRGFNKITGISDSGQIAMTFEDEDGEFTSFIHADGTFSQFVKPECEKTEVLDINQNGHLALQATTLSTDFIMPLPGISIESFVYDGDFEQFVFPGENLGTLIRSINNLGMAAGNLIGEDQRTYVIWNEGGSVYTFDIPASKNLNVAAINDRGILAGSFYDGNAWKGFILDDNDLRLITHPDVSFTDTEIYDMNNIGQIVGSCGNNNEKHGFLATPYYLDSDRDTDSDGRDLARLAGDLDQTTADRSDLVMAAGGFGSRVFFTNL